MQRTARTGNTPSPRKSSLFPSFEADRFPADIKAGRSGSGSSAGGQRRAEWEEEDALWEEESYDPSDDPYTDEYEKDGAPEEKYEHPWAFEDGEDDGDPILPRKPQHRGANAVRIGSGILLAASAAASIHLVLAGTISSLLGVLESEDLAKHLSALVLMGMEGLPIVLGLLASLMGLILANHPRLAAILRPLGIGTAFFSAVPIVVQTLDGNFSMSAAWPYALLLAAALYYFLPVRILRSHLRA